MNAKDVIDLLRPEHALMLAIAVAIGEIISLKRLPELSLLFISIVPPVLIQFGSFSLNDYLDMESDRINKRTDRPLVRGSLDPRFALYITIGTFLVGNIVAYFINLPCFAIAVMFTLLSILYDYKLKDMALMGNAYISLSMAIPFIFGNFAVASSMYPLAMLLATIAFIAGLAREIIKSVQDMEGDMLARNAATLPVIIGIKNSIYLSMALYLLLIISSFLPFSSGYLAFSPLSSILLVLANLTILLTCAKLRGENKNRFKFARKYSLLALFLGLLSYLAAIFKI